MDAIAFQNERLRIKELLFTKAIPNYKPPIPTDGCQTFDCTDCGDRFIIKSSYEYHINRKSLKITYFCRHCNVEKIFFNRCNLLSHIRSHAFKTVTIIISDFKIEPLPLSHYDNQIQINKEIEASSLSCINKEGIDIQNATQIVTCFECNSDIFSSGVIYRDRAKHYTQQTNKLYSCPICLLTLSTQCALRAHLRIHLKEPPYYCPDCGVFLTLNAVDYPYSHYCDSFKMMRATTKLKCVANNCNKIFHPTEINTHLRSHHLKHVYKCSICSVACYKLDNMQKHLKFHVGKLKQIDLKHIDFLQCEMCPGRLVIPGQIKRHLKGHKNNEINIVYPCWTCGTILKLTKNVLDHYKFNHPDVYIEKIFGKVSQESNAANPKTLNLTTIANPLHRASEKCKCFRFYSSQRTTTSHPICKCSAPKIVCNLCQIIITQDWNIIKKHYAIYHKEHTCLDAKILVKKLSMNKYKNASNSSKKRKKANPKNIAPESNTNNNNLISLDVNKFICTKCGHGYEDKNSLENHIVEHRDPFMAYQCMECAESFIAKPSFTTHLLVKHEINDVNIYIEQKKCYSEDSLNMRNPSVTENKPVQENQCNICREQFCNSIDFEKHYRVHGMAFLMKNTNKPVSPEKLKST